MSELISNRSGRNDFRWRLLTTVSALALIGTAYGARDANAEDDTGRPVLWIELGGQFEQQTQQGDVFSPSFAGSSAFQPGTLIHLEKPPLFTSGAEAKLTFEPSGSDWVFSAGIQYGRANGHRKFSDNHHLTEAVQTTQRVGHVHYTYNYNTYYGRPYKGRYYTHTIQQNNFTLGINQRAEGQVAQKQTHAIVDFTAGKDVGLGMFGAGSTSSFNVGVRIAQFVSKASGTFSTNDPKFIAGYSEFFRSRFPSHAWHYYGVGYHIYHATFQAQRNFHGVGPAISWNASVPVLGEPQAGTLNVDWGANAALLFGRQRASGSHQTYRYYFVSGANVPRTHHTSAGGFNRSRTIVVPNVGGFAGLTFSFTNAKVSVGYRGDFFFGAMDAGNDTRKTETVGFYGPFASISVGLGG